MSTEPAFTTAMGRPSKVRHGELSAYTNYGCRCRECTNANTEHYRIRRGHGASKTPPPHGTVTRYGFHKCRCEACRAACTEAKRAYRKRRKFNTERANRTSGLSANQTQRNTRHE